MTVTTERTARGAPGASGWPAQLARAAPAFLPAVLILAGGWARRWMDEDAFINLRIVDQVFAGHGPVFNAGERVEAATSTMWLGVLIAVRALFGWLAPMQWLALIASLVAAVAAFAIGGQAARVLDRDRPGAVIPVGLALVASVAVVWDFSTSGLEMGLVWLWIAAAWLVLATAAAAPATLAGRRRTWCCVVLGLAPLVRPDLTLMLAFVVVAWSVLVRPRRIVRDLVAMLVLPVLYQVFRMGYYASLVPSTALAKDAAGVHLRQGIDYARDFTSTYRLWVTALIVAAVLVAGHLQRRDRRVALATAAMVAGGLAHATYIVVIGGDYMHGRLLLPAFVAVALPASLTVTRATARSVVAAGAVAAWMVVTALWFRPEFVRGYALAPISDWRQVSGARIVPVDTSFGLNGTDAAALYAQGVRGYFRVGDFEPRTANDRDAFILTLGSIGVPAWHAGHDVWVIDIGGLAEPLAARTDVVPGRPAGHRKQVDAAWYDARFTPPSAADSPQVRAARHALTCGGVARLLDDVDGGLSVGGFLRNIVHSVANTRLHIPADPVVAERELCGPTAPGG